MTVSTFVRARTTARIIECRALANGLAADVARECGRHAARAVITGSASPARLLARQGRRPRAHRNPALPA